MRAYLTKYSPRPGCTCCNVKHLHGYHTTHTTDNVRNSKRAGKKAARNVGKGEIKAQLND